MKTKLTLLIVFAFLSAANVNAQTQASMLKSSDPKLAANKKLLYDFWRVVFEGGHMDEAPKYMAETYIQHNPNVASGRKAFMDFFSKFAVAKPVVDTVKAPLIAIIAENDYVTLVFRSDRQDPKDPGQKYSTTWFDMFRIENGKMAEHWDPATK